MHDLDLHVQNEPMSNVNMAIDGKYQTSYLMATVIFAPTVTIAVEIPMYDLDVNLYNWLRSNLCQSKAHIRFFYVCSRNVGPTSRNVGPTSRRLRDNHVGTN